MLARNAESLYWIGRYVERADDTARILDVSVHQLLEDATVDADAATRILLGVLGVVPPENDALDAWSLTELVGYSADQPASIVSSVGSARENARGAREVVSAEMWECLNATWNALPERQRYARWVGPHAFFSYVEDRAAMLNGLAASTMSRDDTWRFYLLGRSVERVDMIVRLLLSRVSDRMNSPAWLTVLRSAGAADTYLRTYRGALDAGRVVQFLLMDRLFPRSVFHALRQAEVCLTELDNRPVVRIGAKAEALRLLGRARSELEFLRPEELLDDLSAQLLSLQGCIRDVGEAVSPAVLPRNPVGRLDRTGGVRDGLAHPGRAHHRLLLRDGRARVVQRGAAHPAQRQPAERDRQPGRDHARHPGLPLHRLLGHHRHGVRPARPAHRARRHRHIRGRDGRRARPGPLRHLGGAGRRGGAGPLHRDAGVHRLRRTQSRPRPGRPRRSSAARTPPTRCSAQRAGCVSTSPTSRGTTGVHTGAVEAWEARTGVCQDFAHLTLLLVREMGVPARYVSGYLLPSAATEIRQTVRGESHAWIEAWTGGWWGYDPTNDIEIGHRHVWVAVGRDYADVPPLKGIYSGGEAAALDVTVDMTRLA